VAHRPSTQRQQRQVAQIPRKSMTKWFKRHEWDFVSAAAVLGFGLGVFGFASFLNETGKTASFFDFLYFGFRLFLFNYDLPGDGVPYATSNTALEIARFLTPATVFYAAIRGVAVSLAQHLSLWRIRNWSGHAVVIGGGKRGTNLALSLLRMNHRVVVVDHDSGCEYQAHHRYAGARILIGDIRDSEVQERSRLSRAGLVIVVTSSEEINFETSLKAGHHKTEKEVRILTHAPKRFSEIFEDRPPFDRQHGVVETRFFNYDANAARKLALEFGASLAARKFPTGAPRLLLIGNTGFLPELLCTLLTQFQFGLCGPPRFTVLADETERFELRLPLEVKNLLSLVAEIEIIKCDSHAMLKPQIELLVSNGSFDLAFIAFSNDLDALQCARQISMTQGSGVHELAVCLRPSHNLGELFGREPMLPGVHIRDLVQLGCGLDTVVNGSLDARAREIHESYVNSQLKSGRESNCSPFLVPWPSLPESLRAANRAQADNIEIKTVQLSQNRSAEFIESMAEAEHRRWMADRILSGWRYGNPRDDSRKLHPSIKSYAELSEPEKQKDRDTITTALRARWQTQNCALE
jgi:voltage-gated potassium channel Kch